MQHDTYRPAVLGRMTGTLGPDGMPLAIRHRLAGQSILARLFPPATWMRPDPTQFEGTAHLPLRDPQPDRRSRDPRSPRQGRRVAVGRP